MAGFFGVRGKVSGRLMWPAWWRRHPVAAVSVLLLLAVGVYTRLTVALGNDHDRYHNRRFHCLRVISGHTLDLAVRDGSQEHTRLRLWGVDDSGPAARYAEEACAFTRDWVANHPLRVELAPIQTRTADGRLLAYLYREDNGQMLNEELICGGFTRADNRSDHVRKARFTELERRARKQGVGCWQHAYARDE